MVDQKSELGKLESVHRISPVFLQRAAIVAALSFFFFLAMIIAFSIRQNIGYFLLATAFLVVEIFTLIGWFSQRGAEFKIFENGFTYKKQVCGWNEIKSIAAGGQKLKYEIKKKNGEKIVLTEMIQGLDAIIKRIKAEIAKEK
jgi:hypothetical protein